MTPPKNPAEAILTNRARACMPGGNTRTTIYVSPSTPHVVSGDGYTVVNVDGDRLIDLQNNYTALIHGHGAPAITSAGQQALASGVSFGMPTPAEVALAEQLAERIRGATHWRFANSGTEAVMYAIRTARAFTGRDEIVRFSGSYHGGCDDVVDYGPGLSPGRQSNVNVLPEANCEALQKLMRERGTDVAAIIVDLMPNRTGLTPLPHSFVDALRKEASAAGALLIADEVITFRLARGGYQETYGLIPDVTVLGKLIGGGLPVGAFGGRAEVMACLDPSRPDRVTHSGTFAANPVVMQMGFVALDMLDDETIARINRLGNRLRVQLRRRGLTVNGDGSLARIVVERDPADLWWRFYRAGLLICPNGLMAVSTPMDDGAIESVIGRVDAALR